MEDRDIRRIAHVNNDNQETSADLRWEKPSSSMSRNREA